MSRPLKVDWQHSSQELECAYKREQDGKLKIRLYALWQGGLKSLMCGDISA